MKCDTCANVEICKHYLRIQYILWDEKHGLGSLNSNIKVEITVKECPFYRKGKPKKPLQPTEKIQKLLQKIQELESTEGFAARSRLIEEMEKHGLTSKETETIIGQLLREGSIYEPKPGWIKRT